MTCEDKNSQVGKKALRAGVWYTISNVATKAILVLTTPIFTRIMTKEDYGVTATFNSWYALLLTFCTLNLTYSIGRAKIDFPDKLDEYVGAMQLTAFAASAVVAVIGLVFIGPFSEALELPPELMVLLALYLLFAPAISIHQAKFKYQYRYKENIFITVYTTVLTVAISLALVLHLPGNRYYGRILGSVIPAVLLSSFFWYKAFKNRSVNLNKTFVSYGLRISLPLILNAISLNILAQSDRVVITKSCGVEWTAVYTLAYQFAILISLIFDSIGQAWLPWFHDMFALKEYSRIRDNLKPLIIFGCYIGLGCVAVAPEAVWILGGENYRDGQWVVAPIVLGLVCKFIYANYEHIELHLKKTQYIAAGTLMAAGLNLVLNLIFVPRYGFVAAGCTTAFSYLILMSVHYFITSRILKVNIYDQRFMYFALFAEIVLAAGFLLLYPYIWLRYGIMVVITLLMLAKNYDLIRGMIAGRRVR